MRISLQSALLLALFATPVCGRGQTAKLPGSTDTDLFEANVPQIEAFYRSHRYTVTQVTRWYLDRIHRYNGIYRDIETLDEQGALATAARLDRDSPDQHPGPLWGIPIVIKANTSIQGW